MEVVKEVLPVSLMFLGNVICGLGSTKALNLPMFTALRRVSILMTMVAEVCFLNARPSHQIVFSIFMMVGGALVAALDDLSYDGWGYTLVLFNNLFTCLNGVWLKKAAISGRCSKMGVLFYNSLFSAVIMIAFFLFESLLLPTVYDHGILYSVLHLADTNGSGGGAAAAVRRLLSEVTTNSCTNLRFNPDGSAAAAAVTTTAAATMAAKQHGSAFGAALAAAGSSVSSSSTPAATVAAVSATAVKIAATQTTVGSTTAATVATDEEGATVSSVAGLSSPLLANNEALLLSVVAENLAVAFSLPTNTSTYTITPIVSNGMATNKGKMTYSRRCSQEMYPTELVVSK